MESLIDLRANLEGVRDGGVTMAKLTVVEQRFSTCLCVIR